MFLFFFSIYSLYIAFSCVHFVVVLYKLNKFYLIFAFISYSRSFSPLYHPLYLSLSLSRSFCWIIDFYMRFSLILISFLFLWYNINVWSIITLLGCIFILFSFFFVYCWCSFFVIVTTADIEKNINFIHIHIYIYLLTYIKKTIINVFN
jgi:hypothetical protein